MKKVTMSIFLAVLFLCAAVPAMAQTTLMIGGTIAFHPGQSSQVISGRLDGGVAVRYEFYASANQTASITLNSDNQQAILSVKSLTGQVLMDLNQKSAIFGMPLPATGGYEIIVYNPGPMATNYNFLLSIPPFTGAVTAIPANPGYANTGPRQYRMGGTIQFALGETMAQISGSIDGGTCTRYDFYAGNDNLLLASVVSETHRLNLGLSDNTGALYVSNALGYAYIRQLLSKTTKYSLDICNPDMTASKFDLMFVIPARIRFAKGSYGAQMNGSVKANGVVSYTAYASAGQTMSVNLQSGTGQPNAFLRISGIQDGVVYLDHQAKLTSWTGYIPIQQDYLIEVVSYQAATNYALNVNIY